MNIRTIFLVCTAVFSFNIFAHNNYFDRIDNARESADLWACTGTTALGGLLAGIITDQKLFSFVCILGTITCYHKAYKNRCQMYNLFDEWSHLPTHDQLTSHLVIYEASKKYLKPIQLWWWS